jgi:hypothetical protein
MATDDGAARNVQLWPRLGLVSCWADAGAASYAAELARLFPQAQVQGKGLLATEGFVSFPLLGYDGAALSLRSHFFEFLPAAGGLPCLAHQLEPGACYSLVLTTGGGLYRYQLHDTVRIMGHYHDCPLLRFEGKAAHISDWFGEKLAEVHVQRALAAALAVSGLRPAFAMVACERTLAPPAYTLFIEAEGEIEQLQQIVAQVETALHDNFHYRYCRQLGQLGSLQLFRVSRNGRIDYLAGCRARGQRLGDIKPLTLDRGDGWASRFAGAFVAMNGISDCVIRNE